MLIGDFSSEYCDLDKYFSDNLDTLKYLFTECTKIVNEEMVDIPKEEIEMTIRMLVCAHLLTDSDNPKQTPQILEEQVPLLEERMKIVHVYEMYINLLNKGLIEIKNDMAVLIP